MNRSLLVVSGAGFRVSSQMGEPGAPE